MTRIIKTGVKNDQNVQHNIVEVENQDGNGLSKFYLITDKKILDITNKIEELVINTLA